MLLKMLLSVSNFLKWAKSRRTFVIISILLALYNEVLVYLGTRYLFWNGISCKSHGNCSRILLVADPQIIGETFDTNIYNGLAIIDSDRFLSNTFRQAIEHTQPDLICFLGDLMDEGSMANTEEFDRYTNRFKIIFDTKYHKTKVFNIPGDNDIGGEHADVVTTHKVDRFRLAFGDPLYLDILNRTRFVHVNLLTHRPPNLTYQSSPSHLKRIIITHISLLSYPGYYSERITNSIRPDFIFSAHQHTSQFITYPPMHHKLFYENAVTNFNLSECSPTKAGDRIYFEVMVPTCSYRMGVKNVGYGFAVIENDELRYTVLWLPNRFTILYSYVVWFCIAILVFLLTKLRPSCCINRIGIGAKTERIKYTRLLPK